MSQEKLKFDLTLSGTYWKTVPEYSIWVDDDCIEKKTIETDSTELFTVSFEKALDDGAHKLQIRLENKGGNDTEVLEDGSIGRDMMLNIESIVIDDIDIGNLKWTLSKYIVDTPVEVDGETTDTLDNCVNLGWNGAYTLEFDCPYYLWLLENL